MVMRKYSCEPEPMPKCPICGGMLLPVRFECVDGSGWIFGWTCDCTEAFRNDYEGQEVILHTISDENGTVLYKMVPLLPV